MSNENAVKIDSSSLARLIVNNVIYFCYLQIYGKNWQEEWALDWRQRSSEVKLPLGIKTSMASVLEQLNADKKDEMRQRLEDP